MNLIACGSLVFLSIALARGQVPVVAPGGVVDAASFSGPVVPGSLLSIFGSNLAPSVAPATTVPLPLTLNSVSVTFNSIPAPLLYVSPGQINAQLPWEVSSAGSITVIVTNAGSTSAPQTVQAAAFSPSIFNVSGRAIAVNLDGSLAAPTGSITGLTSHPAAPGDTFSLLASGLGAVTPPGITGGNSLDTLRTSGTTPAVTIGGVPATVTFSGLSPQFVGVYQINVVMPSNVPPGSAVSINLGSAGAPNSAQASIAVGTGWPQWAHDAQHSSGVAVTGQSLSQILASITYDPLVAQEQAASFALTVHYQVPLVDGNDVYMEFKTGPFSTASYATQTWGETKFSWQNGQLIQQWQYSSDWKAPGSVHDFWEPVFHAALANDALYLPGASGSVIEVDKQTGTLIQRIAPFGSDPNTYETGPISVDSNGNLFYNAIQVTVSPAAGFYGNDATASWLVRVTPSGATTMANYAAVTSPEAPAASAPCLTTFNPSQLPWPPSSNAVPPSAPCGTQRAGLNVAPAIAPDGTIYTVSHAQFNAGAAYLIALNPDLSKKWAASLQNRLNDGCGVSVANGGWLPANGTPGGCRAGSMLGVDPATNQPGDGLVNDSASSTPVVAPDGSVLYGAYTRYNYAQGHMMHFDASGNYLGAFGFGWDTTPAIYLHDNSWSMITKNNHYGDVGSYCDDTSLCPPDRTSTNPASPEQYFVTQLDPGLTDEWDFQNTNTQSCSRNADGSLSCVSDHPSGFEWCVNSPAVDAAGTVFANSEDGNMYAVGQGGVLLQNIFQNLALGAAYTPASLGPDGKIYSQNDGVLFVAGAGN